MPARITLVMVDDDAAMLDVWMRRLALEPDFHCLAVFADAESAFAWLSRQRQPPALVLIDWQLPGMNGIELARRLKRLRPALCTVLITSFKLAELPADAIAIGADGFLHKSMPLAELAPRLREAHAGELPLSGLAARQLVNRWRRQAKELRPPPPLAPQEHAVWACLAEGLSVKEAADRLGITGNTLKTHKGRLFKKLGVRSIPQAVTRWHKCAH